MNPLHIMHTLSENVKIEVKFQCQREMILANVVKIYVFMECEMVEILLFLQTNIIRLIS